MAGKNRTKRYYVDRFGAVEGAKQHKETVRRRRQRERRALMGRNIILDPENLEAEIEAGNAVKCEACGAVLTRLQWRHFQTRCTVVSLAEYRRLYPESVLVAPNLNSNTKITEGNLIAAYGEEVGKKKWLEYRKKQARSNTLGYKTERHGWTPEQFEAYNADRAVTITNLVAKHGKQEGLRLWDSYCEQQRYTNTLEYFIAREGGAKKGREAWLDYNHAKGSSRRIPDIARNFGVSLDEAAAILSSRASSHKSISHGEMRFVDALEQHIGWPLKYTYKTRQFCIWSPAANQPFFYDMCCTARRKMIEYHGDYWHARQTRYASDHVIAQRGMTAEEIWQLDALKQQAAEKRGFQMRVVWETDYQNNGISQELIEWLNTQQNDLK